QDAVIAAAYRLSCAVWEERSREANGAILMPESRAFPMNNDCARRDCTMPTGGGDGATDSVGPGALGAGIGHMPASWGLEADVVIIGAGATGLPAAIAAIDA